MFDMDTPQLAIVMLFRGQSIDTTITNYHKNINITLNNKSATTCVSYIYKLCDVCVWPHPSLLLYGI